MAAIDLHPLVVAVEHEHAFLHLGVAHEVHGRVEGRAVLERTYVLGDARADEVPEGSAHESRMTPYGSPELVHAAASITRHRQVFVHERGARVLFLGHHRRVHLQLIGRGIARSYDVLARVGVGVAAVHEVARGVKALALLHHFGDVGSFAALVACAPEKHAGVVAVAQYQLLHALQVHRQELLVVGHVLRGMRLVARLVDDVEPVLVGQLQITVHGWIVGCAHGVEVVLLQYLHVAAYGLLVHGLP